MLLILILYYCKPYWLVYPRSSIWHKDLLFHINPYKTLKNVHTKPWTKVKGEITDYSIGFYRTQSNTKGPKRSRPNQCYFCFSQLIIQLNEFRQFSFGTTIQCFNIITDPSSLLSASLLGKASMFRIISDQIEKRLVFIYGV